MLRNRALPFVLVSFVLSFLAVAPSISRGDDPTQDGSADAAASRQAARRERLAHDREVKARAKRIAKQDAEQNKRRRFNRHGSKNEPIPAGPTYVDPVSDQGQHAYGYYVTGPFAQVKGPEGLVTSIRRAGMNAAVIDMKDSAGRVTYPTRVEILRESVENYIPDMRALVTHLKGEGIYTIARIACFADPKLPERHPERAIQHNIHHRPWISWGTGGTWLDPYNTVNHDMIIELAREAAAFGFDEVQLDYIRWPVDPGIRYAEYPSETEEPRAQVLLGMMRRMDEAIPIPIGVDVFGLTAFDFGRVEVLGQYHEQWTSHVEVFTPMIYLHAMRAWNQGVANRNQMLIQTGISQMRERLGPIPVIRPFIQSFDRGNSGSFDLQFIADQIRGARIGNADGFLFWHPGSNYGILPRAMGGPARTLVPFDLGDRPAIRTRYWTEVRAGGTPPTTGNWDAPRRRRRAAH